MEAGNSSSLHSWRRRKRRKYLPGGASKKPRLSELCTLSASSSSDDDVEGYNQGSLIFRKDQHLSSALIITEIEYVLKYRDKPEALKTEHKELLKVVGDKSIAHPKYAFAWFLSHRVNLETPRKDSDEELNKLLRIAKDATKISTYDVTGLEINIDVHPTETLKSLYRVKTTLDDFFEHVCNSRRFVMKGRLGKVNVTTCGNMHCIDIGETEVMIITHAHLAGIRDMFCSHFDTLLYCMVADEKYSGLSLEKEFLSLVDIVLAEMNKDPEDVYTLIKIWPSIVIGAILSQTEGKHVFLNTLLEGLGDLRNSPFVGHLTRPFNDDEGEICMRLELSGLCKIFGHPIVYIRDSVNDWKQKGTALKTCLEEMGVVLADMFKLELCRNYYKEMGQWPKLTIGQETPRYIREAYSSGRWTEGTISPWSHTDFHHISFTKTFEYDMFVDPTDLLSDRSIIDGKDQWINEYDTKAYRTIHGKISKPPVKPKSAILSYLLKDRVIVEDIINTIQTNQVPDSWKIIVGVAKEREFKSRNARFYAKLSPEMRLYQTSSEDNIAKTIFPFIKNQSMTMSEEQLKRKLIDISRPKISVKGEGYCAIIVDFSGWCTSFRWELATPTFRGLDNLFGLTNVYEYTHIFPLVSHLIFQDRYDPPRKDGATGDPIEGPTCVTGPEAWMEGQRQKGWTLITILMLLLVAREQDTVVSLLGQGDNQMVIIRIPPPEDLEARGQTKEDYINSFKDAMSAMATRCGLTIKADESWHSDHLIEYSRAYHYKGSQVSTTLKKVSRIHSEANQTVPTFNGTLSGMMSAGSSAAGEDFLPFYSYYVTIVESAHLVRRHMSYLQKHSTNLTVCMMLIGRILGGLPIVIYSQFCTRAVQDILTSNLHLVRTMCLYPDVAKCIGSVLTLVRQRHPDFETLVKDPQSLPIDLPIQPENYLKDKVKEGLGDYIVNRDVRPLFTNETHEQKKNLLDDLQRIRPTNPRLLNKIYSCSSLGVQEKIIAKFSNTRSIQRVAMETWVSEDLVLKSVEMLETVVKDFYRLKAECRGPRIPTFTEIFREYSPGGPDQEITCTTLLAQRMRETMWDRHIEGITMPAQQEQTKIYCWKNIPKESWPNTVLLQVKKTDEDKYTNRGPYNPYFGSHTGQRARRAPLQVIEVGSLVSSIRMLLELLGWVSGDRNVQRLIEICIEEKTTIPLEELMKYSRQVYSGTITHRLSCPTLRRGGMANCNLTFNSWIKIVSDTATQFAKKGDNHNVCFQSVFLHSLQVLNHLYKRVPEESIWGAVFVCSDCTWRIEEGFTLDKVTYRGVPLENSIANLQQKTQPKRLNYVKRSGEGPLAYTVQTARSVALWVFENLRAPPMTLDQRHPDEVVTASFLNLSELKYLDVRAFLEFYIMYNYLYDEQSFENPRRITDPIIRTRGSKTVYDVILDTLARSGNLRGLGVPYREGALGDDDLKTALYRTLTNILSSDKKEFVENHNILTPEDTEQAFMRMMKLQAWSQGVDLPEETRMKSISLEDYKDSISRSHPDIYPWICPVITKSEEEVISQLRREGGPPPPVPEYNIFCHFVECARPSPTESGVISIKRRDVCRLEGTRFMGKHHWVFVSMWVMKNVIYEHHPEGSMLPLYTIGDEQGEVYNIMYHHMTERLMHIEEENQGCPYWHTHEDKIESCIIKGPLSIHTDQCKIKYNHALYTSCMALQTFEGQGPGIYVLADEETPEPDLGSGCDGSLVISRRTLSSEYLSHVYSYCHYSRDSRDDVVCLYKVGKKTEETHTHERRWEEHPSRDELNQAIDMTLVTGRRRVENQIRLGCFHPLYMFKSYFPYTSANPYDIEKCAKRSRAIHNDTIRSMKYHHRQSPYIPAHIADDLASQKRQVVYSLREIQFCNWVLTLIRKGVGPIDEMMRLSSHTHIGSKWEGRKDVVYRLQPCTRDTCSSQTIEVTSDIRSNPLIENRKELTRLVLAHVIRNDLLPTDEKAIPTRSTKHKKKK